MKTPNQKTSEAQVRHLLRGLHTVFPNAREQAGSGNTSWAPDDIIIPERIQIECKATTKDSISVKLSWLNKLRDHCVRKGLRRLLAIRINNEDLYVVDEAYMLHLLTCEREVEALHAS